MATRGPLTPKLLVQFQLLLYQGSTSVDPFFKNNALFGQIHPLYMAIFGNCMRYLWLYLDECTHYLWRYLDECTHCLWLNLDECMRYLRWGGVR